MVQVAEPTIGLREQQRRDTQTAIRQAAMRLALEHGVSAITVQEISRAAGLAPRTFFNHFRPKEEALIPELPPFSVDAEQAFVRASVPDRWEALTALLADHCTQGLGVSTEPDDTAAPMRLVQANPDLLPRTLSTFEEFERRVAVIVARRTGRDPDHLFCKVAATVAASTARAGLDAQRRKNGDQGRPDPAAVWAASGILRQLVHPEEPQA